MKREFKVEGIHKFWPILFWYSCRKCKMQFCREWGWQKRFGYFNGRSRWEYICRECCPTIEEARNVWLPRPPSPPPGQRHYQISSSPPPDQYKYGI